MACQAERHALLGRARSRCRATPRRRRRAASAWRPSRSLTARMEGERHAQRAHPSRLTGARLQLHADLGELASRSPGTLCCAAAQSSRLLRCAWLDAAPVPQAWRPRQPQDDGAVPARLCACSPRRSIPNATASPVAMRSAIQTSGTSSCITAAASVTCLAAGAGGAAAPSASLLTPTPLRRKSSARRRSASKPAEVAASFRSLRSAASAVCSDGSGRKARGTSPNRAGPPPDEVRRRDQWVRLLPLQLRSGATSRRFRADGARRSEAQ